MTSMEMLNLLDVNNAIFILTKNIGTNSKRVTKWNAQIVAFLLVLMSYSLMNLMVHFMDKKSKIRSFRLCLLLEVRFLLACAHDLQQKRNKSLK